MKIQPRWMRVRLRFRGGRRPSLPPAPRAFTLVELLVVIAIIGILSALLLPVLSRAKAKAQGAMCLNCGKQLMLAITLYADDHQELYPPNPDDGNTVPGHNWCAGEAGRGQGEEFNPDVLKDPSRTLVIPYLNRSVEMFRCPADKRTGLYQGANPALAGQYVPAARTLSMNQAVGTICPGFDTHSGHAGAPRMPVNGPWLDNTFHHRRNTPWRTYNKMSAINAPGPSMLWVIIDEDVDGLNDAAFAFSMEFPVWHDTPATIHDRSCGFAFADGHSETHRWLGPAVKRSGTAMLTDPQDRQDWAWMRDRTSGRAQ